jgi:serine/threonine protein kinase
VLEPESKAEKTDRKGKKLCFQLVTAARTYYFIGGSEAEVDEWLKVLARAIDECGVASENFDGKPVSKIGLEDFDLLKVIGKGSFGKVIQVCKKDTKRIYAMKVMNKKVIVEKNDTEHIKAERRILQKVRHPFLMTLHMSFQTPDKLYLVMDFVNGGELFTHMQSVDNFDQDRTRFYVAEITLGVAYLHSLGVIYRDLKPENILLTSDGHICLTDFGISKEGFEEDTARTKTLVGTPEYLAPEVLQGQAYGKAVDWWSLGTLMYEMLDGNPPFWDQDVQKMYRRILQEPLTKFPAAAGPEAQDLLRQWLERDPNKRLTDAKLIKAHAFFASINWDDLYNLKIKPAYVPPVKSASSTSMIADEFTKEDPNDIKPVNSADAAKYASHFDGFTLNPALDAVNKPAPAASSAAGDDSDDD